MIPWRTPLNLQLALGIQPAAWRLAWLFKKNPSFSFSKHLLSRKNQVKPKELNPSPNPAGGLEFIRGIISLFSPVLTIINSGICHHTVPLNGMELRCLCTVTTGTASNCSDKTAFLAWMTTRFSCLLPTVEGPCHIQVQSHPGSHFSSFHGKVELQNNEKSSKLFICWFTQEAYLFRVSRKGFFFCLHIRREMELADTGLFPRLHKEIGKPGNRVI